MAGISLSEIWGATDKPDPKDPKITEDGVDCSHMTPVDAFMAGKKMALKSILQQFDDFFAGSFGPGADFTDIQIMDFLDCNYEEYEAIAGGDIEFFMKTDRLSAMHVAFRINRKSLSI